MFSVDNNVSTNSFVKICSLIFFIALLLFVNRTTAAQTVSGKVSDAKNAAVAQAKVIIAQQNKIVAQTATDDNGAFQISNFKFQISNFNNLILRVTANGFAVFEQKLSDDSSAPLVIVLRPANVQAVVNVTGTETRLGETPASVIVLNRQTLNDTAAQTVDDKLRQVAGFTLFRRASSRTANPTAQGANLRGIGASGASRTAVLFDGVSIADAFGGWTYWTRVPRQSIEQIEVLRGGASTVYGSGGLAGAINIVPRNSAKPVLQIETSGGAQNTVDASVFGAISKNGFGASLALDAFQTRGYFPTPKELRGTTDARADSRFNNAVLTIEKRFSDNLRVFARASIFAERRDNGTRLQTNRTYFRQSISGADFDNQTLGAFAVRAAFETQVYGQSFSAISLDRSVETLSRLQRVPSDASFASLTWSKVFAVHHTVTTRVEAKRVNGFSDENIFANNRQTQTVGAGGRQNFVGLAAIDFWRVTDKLNLNFGARIDFWQNVDALSTIRNLTANRQTTIQIFPNRRENRISPNIGAIYQITPNLSVTAAFNQSFRAPTLNELYRAFRVGNVLTVANENLRAERAANFETGARYNFAQNKFDLRATLFQTIVKNPVANVTLSTAPNLITRQRQNVGATRSRGLEIDFNANLRRDLQISAGYLLVDARVTDFAANPILINKRLPQVARQTLNLQTFYRPNKFTLTAQTRFSASQFDDDLNQFRLQSFFTLDASASYKLLENLEIFTAAENIFNNRYDIALTPTRNIAAPRFVRAGLRFNLSRR